MSADQLSTDHLSDKLRSTVLRPQPDSVSNSALFQRFLELLTSQCSSGSRFHCAAPEGCCAPCSILYRHVQTYVDVATLDEILSLRKDSGLCGYMFCNNRVLGRSSGCRNSSTFKIDLSEQRVFLREVYESFCSAKCIDKNAEVQSSASSSPMETGVITPRAVRNSNPDSLNALVTNLRQLGPCVKLSDVLTYQRSPIPPTSYEHNGSDLLQDKCVMFNYKPLSEVRRVRFAMPLSTSDSVSSVESMNVDSQSQQGTSVPSISDPPVCKEGSASALEDAVFDYSGLYESSESMGAREKTREWYTALLRHVPDSLLSTVSGPLESLLSTFSIGTNTPALDNDLYRILTYVLLYVLLRNGERVLISDCGPSIYDGPLKEVERYLVDTCTLDVDSISVLNELLTERD
ncbi:uncharacterized protein BXIN_2847 [Babesia sp. Xinjiang]|uniref:uncharacterized protein n=1 Tax=Babesia sp. Xinjiang TaxID=462227 RepID=UPI000A21DBF5|nr:uncharacterized protein BXIN_2847 [Babesia sp. Xinjiang]ORM39386.1 hypothetical protein BXIN_2847 [Babesia sp. Xinjiang]